MAKEWLSWGCYKNKSMANSTMRALRRDLGLKSKVVFVDERNRLKKEW